MTARTASVDRPRRVRDNWDMAPARADDQATDGWPYPDPPEEYADPAGDLDLDLVTLRAMGDGLLSGLSPLEQEVLAARFGLGGPPVPTKELRRRTGLGHEELRAVLGSALEKLRGRLRESG